MTDSIPLYSCHADTNMRVYVRYVKQHAYINIRDHEHTSLAPNAHGRMKKDIIGYETIRKPANASVSQFRFPNGKSSRYLPSRRMSISHPDYDVYSFHSQRVNVSKGTFNAII